MPPLYVYPLYWSMPHMSPLILVSLAAMPYMSMPYTSTLDMHWQDIHALMQTHGGFTGQDDYLLHAKAGWSCTHFGFEDRFALYVGHTNT